MNSGDAFLLYAGTMHYTEGGVIFYEIMQNSDVYIPLSFRSSSEKGEELDRLRNKSMEGVHIEDGFDCKTRPITIDHGSYSHTYLLACEYFSLERIDFETKYKINTDNSKFFVFTALEDKMEIITSKTTTKLAPGQTCLIPANTGEICFKANTKASILKAYVPNLQKDIINPLRLEGIQDKEISLLGGITELNHLDNYL